MLGPSGRHTQSQTYADGRQAALHAVRISHLSLPRTAASNDGRTHSRRSAKAGGTEQSAPASRSPRMQSARPPSNATHTDRGCCLRTAASTATTAGQIHLFHARTCCTRVHVHQFRVQHNMPTATGRLVSCLDGPGTVSAAAQLKIRAVRQTQAHNVRPFNRTAQSSRHAARAENSSSGCSSTHARKKPRVQRQCTGPCTPAVQSERGLPERCRLRTRLGPTVTCHTACAPHSQHLQEPQAAQQLPCLITAASTQRASWHTQ